MKDTLNRFGISRIDHLNTHCWFVRLIHTKRRGRPCEVRASFPDKQYGGKGKALSAAAVFRNREACLWKIPPGRWQSGVKS